MVVSSCFVSSRLVSLFSLRLFICFSLLSLSVKLFAWFHLFILAVAVVVVSSLEPASSAEISLRLKHQVSVCNGIVSHTQQQQVANRRSLCALEIWFTELASSVKRNKRPAVNAKQVVVVVLLSLFNLL